MTVLSLIREVGESFFSLAATNDQTSSACTAHGIEVAHHGVMEAEAVGRRSTQIRS